LGVTIQGPTDEGKTATFDRGIRARGPRTIVSGNTIHNEEIGIDAMYRLGFFEAAPPADWLRVEDNQVFDNLEVGIRLQENVLVTNNVVHGQRGYGGGSRGISSFSAGTIANNQVYDNDFGVFAESDTLVENNELYSNAVGVYLDREGQAIGNRIHSNDVGIRTGSNGFRGEIAHNVVYDQTTTAIELNVFREQGRVEFNTIVESVADGIVVGLSSEATNLRNNIISVGDGTAISVQLGSESNFVSDYNLFQITGAGKLADWVGYSYTDRLDWAFELGHDIHSLTADPQFLDINADDFRLTASSPAIDRADPNAPFTSEPTPNGRRANLGAFGNTPLATTTPEPSVQILSPNGYEKFEAGSTYQVTWLAQTGGADPVTVDLEVSIDNGTTWQPLAADLPVDSSGHGSFAWTVAASQMTNGNMALLRANASNGASDTTDSPFLVTNGGQSFYVNIATDSDFADNEYTTAAGNNANTGKSPDSPMASLRAVLALYDLDPGDVVHIDTGLYEQVDTLNLVANDSGVRLLGTSQVDHATVISRGSTTNGEVVFNLAGADEVIFDNLDITGGYQGIVAALEADSDGVQIRRSRVYDNFREQIQIAAGNDGWVIDQSEVYDTSSGNFDGVVVTGDDTTIRSSRIHDLSRGINVTGGGAVIIGNTIYDNTNMGVVVSLGASDEFLAERNEIFGNNVGISITKSTNTPISASVVSNSVYDNASDGIVAGGPILVDSNSVHGNTRYGIWLYNGAIGEGNESYANEYGILLGNSSNPGTAIGNRVFDNSVVGIYARNNSVVERNVAYSNSVGIWGVSGQIDFGGRITDNLAYDNTNQGIRVYNARPGARVVNNTVYQAVGDAVRIEAQSEGVSLLSNILWVDSGYLVFVEADSQTDFFSDRNLFHTANAAGVSVGYWNETDQTGLLDWQFVTGLDPNSLAGDPLFIDRDGADNVLGWDPTGDGYDGGL
ncbi:MAG: right-handed parallel beta-helix repeat-containing protein, partial [Planctomycetales bacterium]|nr:right-handed parallel beta-helix repeat-containing protein [Planctomycetales bacterium]